jgi:hypothetical protein
MKFCSECGSELPTVPTKFCHNCGANLWHSILDSERREIEQPDIYSLGVKLEQMVEQILKTRGFSTERRLKLKGESGATHEIDVLAKREIDVVAVECKNYGEARSVGIKELRDFQSKLRDLPQINHAMFVTNIKFTSGVEEFASHNHIELWDGDKLGKDFYLVNLGRLGSTQAAEPAAEVFGCALPILTQYNEVAKLLLVNPHAANIAEATLVLHPYFVFTYEADIKKGLLRKEKIREHGKRIVDATNKKIIQVAEKETFYKDRIYHFFTKIDEQNQVLEDILDEMEKTQTIEDLNKIECRSQYRIERSSEYAINALECKVPANAAERMVLEDVVKGKNVEDEDVRISKPTLIYVPKWLINIESKTINYRREVLPASETVIIDEIAFCPKDLSEKRRASKKKTYAVCEICGHAYCGSHIFPMNDVYYCEKHTYRSSTNEVPIKPKESIKSQTNNVESSLSNIKNNLEYSIDKALEKRI